MKIYKSYIVFLIFLLWSIFSIILPVNNSGILARFWQISYLLIYLFALATIINQPNIFSNKIVRIVLLWSFYVSITNIFFIGDSPISYWETLIDVNWWPMVFILFYGVFAIDYNSKYYNLIVKVFPLFFILVCALVIYNMMFFTRSVSLVQEFIDHDYINSIFWILLVVPFSFLLKSKKLKYTILIISLILVVVSTKRSALISVGLIFIFSLYQDIFRYKKFVVNLMYALLFGLTVYLFSESKLTFNGISGLDRLTQTEIQEEARFEFISESWDKFKAKGFMNILHGSGHRSTAIDRGRDRGRNMLSKTVHNDFLEVLYDYGITGLLLYLFIMSHFFVRLYYLYKIGGMYFEAYFASICIYLVLSMVSHLIIYPTYFAFLVILWALIEAKVFNKNNLQRATI